MSTANNSFNAFFRQATDHDPYPFQMKLANCEQLPELIDIPTGLGKTDAVVLAWLWRRRFASAEVRAATPRRLVYCLPMRVLVEQTRDKIRGKDERKDEKKDEKDYGWLERLGMRATEPSDNNLVDGWAKDQGDQGKRIAVTVLMGGEDKNEWDRYPERDAIIIGTQDMLLSRVLNRGYGMSRYRWPMHFGLLNNDCLWVMDEVQLMGVGVETSAQVQAFCNSFGTVRNVQYIWMSATLDEDRLATVDHPLPPTGRSCLFLNEEDKVLQSVIDRFEAKKQLKRSVLRLDKENEKDAYCKEFADLLLKMHNKDALTLAVVNRVKRAQDIYVELLKKGRTQENTAVLHSRFREGDRKERMKKLLDEKEDSIIVATQVVEAGVDVSARAMVTELAPWSSMVQRFGRCNRKGEDNDATIEWIDLDTNEGDDGIALPYDAYELDTARGLIERLEDAGSKTLGSVDYEEPLQIRPVVRRKDILDLFDTTPDLTGNDLDVSRYIREGQDKDVQVYWRELPEDAPTGSLDSPRREELCSVSISQINNYLKKYPGWIWDPLDARWFLLGASGERRRLRPGQVILLHPKNGGYKPTVGWVGLESDAPVDIITQTDAKARKDSGMNEDPNSQIDRWVTLLEHVNDVSNEVKVISDTLSLPQDYRAVLENAARWHDVGKIHLAFQNMLLTGKPDEASRRTGGPWAKSDGKAGRVSYWVKSESGMRIERPYFRHELASALSWLQANGHDYENEDLIAYLIVAHHGKVRMSIRSLRKEAEPLEEGLLFARGIWDGDELPPLDGFLPEGIKLDLSIMQMGEGSWLERMLWLRDNPKMGPFKLAYLESILRVADWRASEKERVPRYDK
jgi:CRISPR-associated endonuclease/helicase Cas3